MDNKHQQNEGLLSTLDEGSDCSDSIFLGGKETYEEHMIALKKRKGNRWLPWALHLTVFVAYAVFFVMQSLPKTEPKKWPDIYDGLKINEHFHETSLTSPFQGRPSKKSTEAWHNMLNVGIVSINEEEKSRLPFDTSRNIHRENEYVVELNIFHQLHCLHGLRQQIYNPQPFSWQNDEPVSWLEFHMNHCIEHLRETLMCNADITPQRFDWDIKHNTYILDSHQQFPNCKNWADIWTWAESRNTTGDLPGIVTPA